MLEMEPPVTGKEGVVARGSDSGSKLEPGSPELSTQVTGYLARGSEDLTNGMLVIQNGRICRSPDYPCSSPWADPGSTRHPQPPTRTAGTNPMDCLANTRIQGTGQLLSGLAAAQLEKKQRRITPPGQPRERGWWGNS